MIKRTILYFIFLAFCLTSSFGQDSLRVDSLRNVWKDQAREDSVRLKALSELNQIYYVPKNLDSAIIIAQTIIDLAKAKKLPKFLGEAYGKMGIAKHYSGQPEAALPDFDLSKKYFLNEGNIKGAAGTLINKGNALSLLGRKDDAIAAYKEGIALCDSIGELEYKTNGTINLGVIYLKQGKDKEALIYFNEALELLKNLDNKTAEAGILVNIGITQRNQGNYDEAIASFTKSMHIAEANNLPEILIFDYSKLGVIATMLDEPEQALDYVEKGIAQSEAMSANRLMPELLNTKGVALGMLGRKEESLVAYQKSAEIAEKTGEAAQYGKSMGNIGAYYNKNGDHQKAIGIFEKALEVAKKIEDIDQQIVHYANLGNAYHSLGKFNRALEFKLKAFELTKPLDILTNDMEISKSLHETYAALGQSDKALEMLELHLACRDSVNREENKKALYVQEYKYESEKEAALAEQRFNNELKIEAQKQKTQQVIIAAVAIGLLLAIALSILLFNRLKLTRQQKEAIALAKEKAEESERFKQQFLANMSHEIRTPMHAVSGMVKILRRSEHLPEQEPYLQAMQTSSDNLLVILNDVLDMSKIEAGKIEIEHVPMAVTEVVDNVVSLLKYKAEDKGLRLTSEIEADVPPLVMGDPARISQILTNLMGNAIKFTEKGSVEITLSKIGDQLRFAIKDTGIGIPKDKLTTIFSSFEQVKNSQHSTIGGTGLGLSISRQLVELMGGKIWAESEAGKGSVFFVEIPLIVADTEAAGKGLMTRDDIKQMATTLQGIKILLAEDNDFNQMIAQDDLAYFIKDVSVEICENGKLALEQYETNGYDLILMDVQMPEMDGFEATRAIRKLEREMGKKHIPIIAMTASLLSSEIDACYEAGMDSYIPKPYKADELIGTIYREYRKRK